MPPATRTRFASRTRTPWVRYSDEQLLEFRLCDLNVRLDRTPTLRRIRRLYRELQDRGLTFRPHVWVSSEWFSPDGIPGIAVPFYLCHPRLAKLEYRMMFEVEGYSEESCMRILRHEAGHAICNAYRLHYRKRWRQLFGHSTQPYPQSYRPEPTSRRFVLHLDRWYAQSHPAEDFAETFAVWLTPRSNWRIRYHQWPAIAKLEYVDELMNEIAGNTPPVSRRMRVEPLSQLRMTLREHYKRKQRRFADDWPEVYDHDLKKVFSSDRRHERNETAASFLRRNRRTVRDAVSHWTGEHQYTIDQILRDMIDRSRELRLRCMSREQHSISQTILLVTVQTLLFLHTAEYSYGL